MKVKMLKGTYIGRPLNVGDIVALDDVTAARLQNRGIAEIIAEPVEITEEVEQDAVDAPEEPQDDLEGDAVPEAIDLHSLTTKELFELCKQSNITLDKAKINGKTTEEKQAYLIGMLKGSR